MSDLIQLLADITKKSRISKIWVTSYNHDDMYVLNRNQIDLYIYIAAVEQMLPYMFCTRASGLCTLRFMLSAEYAGYRPTIRYGAGTLG